MEKIEKFIVKRNLDEKKIADVLRDYNRGNKYLYEICQFWGYPLERAIAHIKDFEAWDHAIAAH